MGLLDGKSGVLFGASRGIGEGIAIKLGSEGANLVLCSRDTNRINEKVVPQIKQANSKAKIIVMECNIKNEEEIEKVVDKAMSEFGCIDIAVNNSGIMKDAGTKIEDFDPDLFNDVYSTNVRGYFLCLKHEIRAMKKCLEGKGEEQMGSIVNVSSTMGITALTKMPGCAIYASTKSSINMMTKYAAMENGDKIRVNAVNPGIVESNMTEMIDEEQASKQQFIGRKGRPIEIGNLTAFLLSDQASLITAETHVIDGGWALTCP